MVEKSLKDVEKREIDEKWTQRRRSSTIGGGFNNNSEVNLSSIYNDDSTPKNINESSLIPPSETEEASCFRQLYQMKKFYMLKSPSMKKLERTVHQK